MAAYATVQQLRDRWPDMPTGSDAHAETLLDDASALMLAECPAAADADPAILVLVAVDIVKAAMQGPEVGAGVSSLGMTAGPYSQQVSYSNPAGDLYLSKKHKRLLGCGGQSAFTIDLTPNGAGYWGPDRWFSYVP